MTSALTPEQLSFFAEKGYLVLRDTLSAEDKRSLQVWTEEVHDLPRTAGVPWMPYEEVTADGKRVLCRTENFADYHDGFGALLRGPRVSGIVSELAGQEMLLFKEKINYKHPGAGGYAPHIDSTAYVHVKNTKQLSLMLAVDEFNMSNGGLEVVEGSHDMTIPLGADNNITPEWVAQQKWAPVELEPGQLLIFGSYLAHRSGANTSPAARRAVYATYNAAAEGDLHKQYYAHRAEIWPATHMRDPTKDYSEGALRYGFGSPMLSVDSGKQLQV